MNSDDNQLISLIYKRMHQRASDAKCDNWAMKVDQKYIYQIIDQKDKHRYIISCTIVLLT